MAPNKENVIPANLAVYSEVLDSPKGSREQSQLRRYWKGAHQGWLEVENSAVFGKKWSRRWVTLGKKGCVYWFKAPDVIACGTNFSLPQAPALEGQVDMNISFVKDIQQHPKGYHVFEVICNGKTTLRARAESLESKMQWVTSFRSIMRPRSQTQ
jgi:hypothetical protein